MKAYVFPGQGAQFPGMGQDLFESSTVAQARFKQAEDILGFDIASVMFEGTPEQLKETKVTQPAIFLHSVILAECLGAAFAAQHGGRAQPWRVQCIGGCRVLEFRRWPAAGERKSERNARGV
jgi:[acyl-carrier-protein] S-malonyltransferase